MKYNYNALKSLCSNNLNYYKIIRCSETENPDQQSYLKTCVLNMPHGIFQIIECLRNKSYVLNNKIAKNKKIE